MSHTWGPLGRSSPNQAWEICGGPTAPQSVQITSTNPTVGDLDIDVGFFPCLGLVFLPHHFAIDGIWVLAQPARKLVICTHGCGIDIRLILCARLNSNVVSGYM